MERMQEDTIASRTARHTRQGSIKLDGGHWKQGRLQPHEPLEWQGEGHYAGQTRPVKAKCQIS